MLYLAWDREINISLFFCDVFVWKWGPRPRTSSRCYHGNKSAATFKKGIFVHSPWVPNCMQNLKGGWKFPFPKMFDSFRDLFLRFKTNTCSEKVTLSRKRCLNIMSKTETNCTWTNDSRSSSSFSLSECSTFSFCNERQDVHPRCHLPRDVSFFILFPRSMSDDMSHFIVLFSF